MNNDKHILCMEDAVPAGDPALNIPNTQVDLLVFIGRFQPFHNQHKRVIDIALTHAKHVLVLVGSAGSARTIRNPFTFDERKQMIMGSYDNEYDENGHSVKERLLVRPLFDKTYNDTAWEKQVQDIVVDSALHFANNGGFHNNGMGHMKIGLIGAAKDHTSYYLKKFPQWKEQSINVPIHHLVHATEIREAYFEGIDYDFTDLPNNVLDFLFGDEDGVSFGFESNPAFYQLQDELNFVRKYKEQWAAAPYPVKHATVDAVVEQSGHVLLVKRKSEPGKGLWALPGGHLNEYEKQLDGAIRELKEETKLKVPEAVLRGSIHADETFDDPYRSTLGRVITRAFHIKLVDADTLPKVKGADDAEKAKWVPLAEIREDMLFDDHYHIIQYFLGL